MVVTGKNAVIKLNIDGELKPVACAKTGTLTTTADITETSIRGSGKWKTYKGTKLGFIIQLSGICSLDMNISLAQLRNAEHALEPVAFSMEAIDENSNSALYTGYLIITSIGETTNYNGNLEYTMNGTGTEDLIIDNGS